MSIPAFPLDKHQEGMTLRDYFAAKAMQAMHTSAGYIADKGGLAEEAYAIADAMLVARKA